MDRFSHITWANIAVTIVYFVTGLLTLSLSLPPSGGTVLWVPSGIMLALVLIWGYRLLPGVFLGDFLVAYYLADTHSPSALILCVLFGTQAALHAGLGRFLLTHFKVWPSTLVDAGNIAKFFILAAVATSLPPAVLTVLVEQCLGILAPSSWLNPMIMWWIGSALGVVIFTPITLILLAEPKEIWRTRIVSFVIPMLLLFISLVFSLHAARTNEFSQVAYRFDNNVKLAHSLVERKWDLYDSFLKGLRAFFQNNTQVTEHEFNAYIEDFFDDEQVKNVSYPLVWIQRVPDENRLACEQQYNYEIRELGPTSQTLIPASKREDYFVTHFYKANGYEGLPSKVGIDTKGVDICAGKQQQEICQKIISSGQGQIMPYFDQTTGEKLKSHFLYLLPVLNQQKQVIGFVGHLFEYSALVENFLSPPSKQWLEVSLIEPDTGATLYSTVTHQTKPVFYNDKHLVVEKWLGIPNQQWSFHYSPSQHFIDKYSSWMSYWVMTAAFIAFGFIAFWLMASTGRAQSIKKEVNDKTREITLKAKLLAESEEKYRCLIENIQDEYLIYSYDTDGVYTYISPSVESILGYEQEEFLTHYATHMSLSDINEQAKTIITNTLSGHSPSTYEMEIKAKSGELHTLHVHENPIYGEDRQTVVAIEGIARDITASKKAQKELEKLSLAIKHSPNAVIITDREGNIEYVNPKFTTITGYSEKEAIGKWPDITSSEDTSAEVYKELWQTLLSGLEWRGELQNRKKNGDLYWAHDIITPMLDDAGHVTHFVVTQEDITEAHRINEKRSYQASHDLLTGLMNRNEFEDRLSRAITASKRDLTEHALCFLDLDQFKVVNDTCGHIAGDELLRQIGSLMSSNIRSRDTLARLGGDEFALLMEHCGIEQAHQACEQIIKLFENFRFHWEEHVFAIGISIGLSIIDQHIADNSEAMSNADSACYEAKNNGRNQIKVHTEHDARLQKRRGEIQWSSEISNALDEDRLLLYAQPIVGLGEKASTLGYELLLRMEMTDGRIVPPGAFLPAAERYNSATRIDRWVVNHSLRWMSRHADQLEHVDSMSINLSGQSLGDEAMTMYITKELQRGGIPAQKINFEITETAAIANLRDATTFIGSLKKLGCRFALDDFGSGLSSFAYLKNLNVDTLKIDGMFIKDILSDSLDYEMVKSINEIGHVMGLETVAEFVESEEILEKLKEIGVDFVQGYSIGKPVAIDEILKKQK